MCVPASKSIANRALLLAALAKGRSELREVPNGDDTLRMIDGLRRLGVIIRDDSAQRTAVVEGVGGVWPVEEAEIDAGDAGSVLRFLTAAACLGESDVRLDGSEQLRSRPMAGLVESLTMLGARLDYVGQSGHCPLGVRGSGLRGGNVEFQSPQSSQFVSALLMVAPLARSDVFVDVGGTYGSRPYVAMTQSLMESYGAAMLAEGGRYIVPGGQAYSAQAMTIEPDASAAGYLFALAALAGGRVTVAGLNHDSLQGDVRIVDLLAEMGCRVEQRLDGLTLHGGIGPLRGIRANLADIPDAAPTLAVVAAFAGEPTRLEGLAGLRHKESDRLFTTAHNLRRLDADVEISDDALTIRPGAPSGCPVMDAYDDHRIAMAFSLASARLDGVVIHGADCVRKSFPAFFDTLGDLDN